MVPSSTSDTLSPIEQIVSHLLLLSVMEGYQCIYLYFIFYNGIRSLEILGLWGTYGAQHKKLTLRLNSGQV